MTTNMADTAVVASGLRGVVSDWSGDKQAFPVPWGKAMMWIFLLSDTFIFSCFLTGYMNVRISTTVPWPNVSEVFSLHIAGRDIPLILIAIMTFDLITSSGTMAMAVNSYPAPASGSPCCSCAAWHSPATAAKRPEAA